MVTLKKSENTHMLTGIVSSLYPVSKRFFKTEASFKVDDKNQFSKIDGVF